MVAYRRDKANPSVKQKHLFLITVLPPGKSTAKPGTPKIMVEGVDYDGYMDYISECFPELPVIEVE